MRRVEIIGNHSVEQDLMDGLDEKLGELFWTKLQDVQGKGTTGYKFGDGIWPESNFLWFSYCSEGEEAVLREIVEVIRNKHNREGIVLFSVGA